MPHNQRLNIIEFATNNQAQVIIKRILHAYPTLARWYARVRFQIMPSEMLDAIEQHLPAQGIILDVGCGFGLFTLYLALKRPDCHFVGMELSARRVSEAKRAAALLQVRNVEFICADLATSELPFHPQAAYCTDLLHHMTPEGGDHLLMRLYDVLVPGGPIIVKDITTQPRLKLYYTFILDLLVNPKDSFYYRSAAVWRTRLSQFGFTSLQVYPLRHYMPYPHFLLVGNKPQ